MSSASVHKPPLVPRDQRSFSPSRELHNLTAPVKFSEEHKLRISETAGSSRARADSELTADSQSIDLAIKKLPSRDGNSELSIEQNETEQKSLHVPVCKGAAIHANDKIKKANGASAAKKILAQKASKPPSGKKQSKL